MSLDILVVCTANICRSPAAARTLRTGLRALGMPPEAVSVSSAGVQAMTGAPMCEVSETEVDARLSGFEVGTDPMHTSQPLTVDMVEGASLVLTADRQHRRSILMASPRQRDKVFTLRQAARLSQWLVSDEGALPVARDRAAGNVVELDPLDPRFGVPPLPTSAEARQEWFVAELHAARGLVGQVDAHRYPDWEADDIGDPHVEGTRFHPVAADAIVDSALAVVRAIGVLHEIPTEALDQR